MRLLIDTNAYAAMRRGDDRVRSLFKQADEILLSTIVLGELLFGFRLGDRFAENVEALNRFLASPFVRSVPVTATTADRHARIAVSLRTKSRPIPTNDIWIAAHALETGADLVSFDDHFDSVDGLVRALPGG